MFNTAFIRCLLTAICLSLLDHPASAQPATDYQPSVGQEGKDVIWVPTPQGLVDKMLDLGIEYNPDMVELSKRNAAQEGVSDKASFMKADLFESDFSQAQVITMFLLSSINIKLRPKILDLKPGTRIVSNTFDMGEWKPDETATLPGCNSWCTAHLWRRW